MESSSAWIQTFTGKKFYLLAPTEDMVDIRDIAHALSMLVRYTGHVSRFYSVAEHSLRVSEIVPPEIALDGLLHDAHEAYTNDLARPLKHCTPIGTVYKDIAERIQAVIRRKFGIKESPQIKSADTAMLYREKEELLSPMYWGDKWGLDDKTPANVPIIGYPPEEAERLFLQAFRAIRQVQSSSLPAVSGPLVANVRE